MTRKLFLLSSAILVALSISACGKKADADTDPKTGTSKSTEAPAPKIEDIPEELKHAGYKYYGLGSSTKMTFSMAVEGSVQEGTQTSQFAGMSDGKAVFNIVRDGVLATMGNEKYMVNSDGVFITGRGSDEQPEVFAEPVLALPADAKVGATWSTKLTTKDVNGAEVQLNTSEKVVKQEKIKVPAGEFDCIVVSTTGTMTVGGKSGKISGTGWYAAGTGPVKLEIIRPNPDDEKKPIKYTLLLEKVGG
ncbi:hypothetical protein QPK87_27965 [Kamptonema cortianum]|nr:hypothetical protein [Geitlerinema splendidum]MDK3160364.1 hypothetical protein [Kamptonema cortianum]